MQKILLIPVLMVVARLRLRGRAGVQASQSAPGQDQGGGRGEH